MASEPVVVTLSDAAGLPVALVGGKAAALAGLLGAGFPVPEGVVVTSAAWAAPVPEVREAVRAALTREGLLGRGDFAVRSSAAAEDLVGASYAGQYETFLDVPTARVGDAIYRCREAAESARVAAYQAGRGGAGVGAPQMAVLVQPMVAARAAGVAFTANPLTGDRQETLVTAVRGLGERLVSGQALGDEWSIRDGTASLRRGDEDAITAGQALAVGDLAARVQAHLGGPQDIEWALAAGPEGDRLVLLQARPMTALPEPVTWSAPGPGRWTRNFRLGEWLPEPMTPLFADWVLPLLEDGYLEGMRDSVGAAVPFRYAIVNGWYFNAPPVPRPAVLVRALASSRGRILRILYNALIQVSRNPPAADRAVLAALYRTWRDVELPAYRRLVEAGQTQLAGATAAATARAPASDEDLLALVEAVARAAGRHLWFLAVVGGSAWKMEDRLGRFADEHLGSLTRPGGSLADGVQVLLAPLPGVGAEPSPHAVFSADWYWPTAGATADATADRTVRDRRAEGRQQQMQEMVDRRETAEADCLAALATSPPLRRDLVQLLEVTRRYAVIREEQARTFTLGWPLLRSCALRLGASLVRDHRLDRAEQVFFLLRTELDGARPCSEAAERRRAQWQQQRQQPAPLALGVPPRLIGDPIARAVQRARHGRPIAEGAIVGQPASPGRATGPVRLVTEPDQFDAFQPGEILLARATAPAWTPLFARAAGVVTDGGALAAHASIVAREYGIPAVVGTGDATHRLVTGQTVTVDGTAGTVTPAGPAGP